MPQLNMFGWLTLCLSLALLGGAVAKKLKQSPVIGYLIAGVALGELASRFAFPQTFITTLSEIGLTFLMFTLGLEMSFARLNRAKDTALLGAIIQILTIIVFGLFIFPSIGFNFNNSIFLAAGFALSSTAVVVKILADRGEINNLDGEIILGWLLVQDLAVLPMVIILPVLAGSGSIGNLAISLLKAVVFLGVVIFLGNQLAHRIIARVANLQTKELLLGTVVVFCLLTAFITNSIGLSLSLGAFIAGLILAKTNERLALIIEVRPLRDFFSIIFFTSLGMMLKPEYLIQNLGLVLSISLLILVIKVVVVGLIIFFLGYHLKTVIDISFSLFQVGEFAVILAGIGLGGGFIDDSTYSLILSVTMITIFITPGLMRSRSLVYKRIKQFLKHYYPQFYLKKFGGDYNHRTKELNISNHTVICGYGRVGSWLGKVMKNLNLPFVVVDYNLKKIEQLNKLGIQAIYGDPADREILDYAQVDKAKMVVVAIPDMSTQEAVVANCLSLNPDITILSRTHKKEDSSRLKALGVQQVVQPEFEASLSVIRQVLEFFAVSHNDISKYIKEIKLEQSI